MLNKVSHEQAEREVKRYAYMALGLALASLVLFWWLAIAGFGAGLRAFMLTYHEGNKQQTGVAWLKGLSGGAVVLAIGSIVLHSTGN